MSQPTGDMTRVLNAAQVKQKILRMAYEIYENNFSEKSIVFAGIDGQGYALAKILAQEVEAISSLKTTLIRVSLDKFSPVQSDVTLDVKPTVLKKKTLVLVDDVLNTGRTLAYALKPLLEIEVKRIEVAVLVNRHHPVFPIVPTYSGLALATTLSEHVEVRLGKDAAVNLR